DVVGLERHVMQSLPAGVEEPREEPLAQGLEQLHLPAAWEAQLEPSPRVLIAAHQVLAAEAVAIELERLPDRAHGDRHVVELERGYRAHGHFFRLPQGSLMIRCESLLPSFDSHMWFFGSARCTY